PDWPPTVRTLDGVVGKAGYEGIHSDDKGNLLLIEDSGGTSVNVDPSNPNSPKAARNPNSFVYRFVPYDPEDLFAGGRLHALQVLIGGALVNYVPVNTTQWMVEVFLDAQIKIVTLGREWDSFSLPPPNTAVLRAANINANAAVKAAEVFSFKLAENA